MNERLNELRRIPLPTGDEPVSWLVDMTPQRWLRKTFATSTAPYTFSPCGVRVRLLMPRNGRRRTLDVLDRLTEQAGLAWVRREMADESGAPRDATAERIATAVLMSAVYETDSPFQVVTVWPNGRVCAFSGRHPAPHHQVLSWHPSVPWGGQ